MRTRKENCAGFTLVEIAVAVAILGIAMVTLIGLHTSHLGNFILERNRTQAALHGKYILSMLETSNKVPDPGASENSLKDTLLELNKDLDSKTLKQIEGWTYIQQVTVIPISVNEDALRQITATISWGDKTSESLSLVYFMKSKKQ